MSNVLTRLLKKRNVNEFSELTAEEKETYRQWEIILNGRKLTDDDVARFLEIEKQQVEEKLINPETVGRADVFLKMKLEFITKIQTFLNSPKLEKAMLEQQINNMLNQ